MKRLMFLMTTLAMISVAGLTACEFESNTEETSPEQQNTSETQKNTEIFSEAIHSKSTNQRENQLIFVNDSTEGTVLSQSEGEPFVEKEVDYLTNEVNSEAEVVDEEIENQFEQDSMNLEEEEAGLSEDEVGEQSEYIMEEDNYESE